MEDDGESGGPRLSKRFAGGKLGGAEVDYKTKAGTAWSHSYLNQKPWHPLSYPNQRRKWIAEQTHAQRERRAEEVSREFTQEQEFFRQTALLSDKEKEKLRLRRRRPSGPRRTSTQCAALGFLRCSFGSSLLRIGDRSYVIRRRHLHSQTCDNGSGMEARGIPLSSSNHEAFSVSLGNLEENIVENLEASYTAESPNSNRFVMEMMKAVSFMYLRPPGYNAESAKAAEIADEQKKAEQDSGAGDASSILPTTTSEPTVANISSDADKKKARQKDVFGRPLPTEEEFEVLKNAPRLETGVPARVKPFAVEIRNVRCVRCGKYGHQSGDRECPLKDAIMPNEESRLKRDDPLMAIKAQSGSSEPLKWELKQRPGMSPPRGGFNPDDPNQQIVAADDIFDEYGGFLSGGDIPALLSNFNSSKSRNRSKSKHKHKQHLSTAVGDRRTHANRSPSLSYSDAERDRQRSNRKHKKNKRKYSDSSGSESSAADRRQKKKDRPLSDSDTEADQRKSKRHKKKRYHRSASSSDSADPEHHHRRRKYRRRRCDSTSRSG